MTPDETLRIKALEQAVEADKADSTTHLDDGSAIVTVAQAFYDFLNTRR